MEHEKIIWIIIIIIIAALAYTYWSPKPIEDNSITAEGSVTEINFEAIAFDGPALVFVSTLEGEKVVAVPSMGINLCAAVEDITDVFALKAGDRVSVRGELDEEGRIVPCSDASHYLRVEGDSESE